MWRSASSSKYQWFQSHMVCSEKVGYLWAGKLCWWDDWAQGYRSLKWAHSLLLQEHMSRTVQRRMKHLIYFFTLHQLTSWGAVVVWLKTQQPAPAKAPAVPAVRSITGRQERAHLAPTPPAKRGRDLALNLKCNEYVDRPATESRADL